MNRTSRTRDHDVPADDSAQIPLVVRFGRVGDMALHIPLLRLLHKRYRHPCTVLTSGPWSRPLFAGSEDVASIWQLRARHGQLLLSPERWRVVLALRRHRGPIYVTEDMPRHIAKIRRLFWLAGIGPDQCVFLIDHPIREVEHWVDRLQRIGQLTPKAFDGSRFPVVREDIWSAPRLAVGEDDRRDLDAWLRKRGFSPDRPLVVLHPGNKRSMKWGRPRSVDSKAWPVERWVGLVRAMHRLLPAATLLLCGSKAEQNLLDEIHCAAALDVVALATDDLPLRRYIALLEIAHSMVAVDTGPAHLAAAVGCPLVVLYGADSPLRWSRRSPVQRPVLELGGTSPQGGIRDIQLDDVIDAWLSVAPKFAQA